MDELIKEFPHAFVRDFKGGKEFRVRDLDYSIDKARKIISKLELPVEIFNISCEVRSFSVRNK